MHAVLCLANVSLMMHLHPAVTFCTADMVDMLSTGLSLHCLAFHAIFLCVHWEGSHFGIVTADICQSLCRSHADLINLATRLIALVQAFDAVAADQEALAMASDKFQDLLKVLGTYSTVFFSKHTCCCQPSRQLHLNCTKTACVLALSRNDRQSA